MDAEDTSPATAQAAEGAEIDALVERWWREHVVGSPLGHYTEAWNVMQAAKERLKEQLLAFLRSR